MGDEVGIDEARTGEMDEEDRVEVDKARPEETNEEDRVEVAGPVDQEDATPQLPKSA